MLNGSIHQQQQQMLPHPANGPISNTTPSGAMSQQQGAAASSSSSAGNSLSRFDSLEQTLEMFIENARHLCVIVSDFQGGNSSSSTSLPPNNSSSSNQQHSAAGGSQSVLNQKLQTLIVGLREFDQAKHQFQDVKIPLELFDQFVDAGRNPQSYTKECMERTLSKNTKINGKTQLYKKFRAHLLKELSEEFPKETMQYRAAREQAANSSSSGTASASSSANNGSTASVVRNYDGEQR